MVAMQARCLCACLAVLTLLGLSSVSAQIPAEAVPDPPSRATNPVADPAAIVKLDHVRFTVLTPQLIRMEWAQNGKFEDHPSFVFLNRRLPVPPFRKQITGSTITIDTGKLHLVYHRKNNTSGFTAANLAITLQV